MHRSLEKARKVRPSQTAATLLIDTSLPNDQKLEQELPKWVRLQHQNILPLYGTVDIGTRLYLVSCSLRVEQHKVEPSSLGVTIVRKRKSA